jgi:hypothetical protein
MPQRLVIIIFIPYAAQPASYWLILLQSNCSSHNLKGSTEYTRGNRHSHVKGVMISGISPVPMKHRKRKATELFSQTNCYTVDLKPKHTTYRALNAKDTSNP